MGRALLKRSLSEVAATCFGGAFFAIFVTGFFTGGFTGGLVTFLIGGASEGLTTFGFITLGFTTFGLTTLGLTTLFVLGPLPFRASITISPFCV